jgi:hypothetical protein
MPTFCYVGSARERAIREGVNIGVEDVKQYCSNSRAVLTVVQTVSHFRWFAILCSKL